MRLPKSFNDITVQQYQDCVRIINDKDYDEFLGDITPHVRLLAYLSGNTEDKILELCTKSDIIKYYKELDFLNDVEALEQAPLKRLIVANGNIYHALIGMEDFKSGQNLTLKMLEEKNNISEYLSQMLATMYVPVNWFGKPKKYKASRHSKISEDLKHARLGDVYGMLVFKKKVFEVSSLIMESYLKQATQTIQGVMPEVMEWAKKNPHILAQAGLKLS